MSLTTSDPAELSEKGQHQIDWSKYKAPSAGTSADNFAAAYRLKIAYFNAMGLEPTQERLNKLKIDYSKIYGQIATFEELKTHLETSMIDKTLEDVASVDVAEFRKLEEMFKQDYVDERVVSDFCKYVQHHSDKWASSQLLAPYAAMIQSSGTGKSRLIKESGRKLWLFYFCCRNQKSTGFPPRSAIIDWIPSLQALLVSISLESMLALYMLFLAACLDELRDFIVSRVKKPEANQKPESIDEDTFILWRDRFFGIDDKSTSIGVPFEISVKNRLRNLVHEYLPDIAAEQKSTEASLPDKPGSSKNINTATPSEQLSETGSSKNINTARPSEQLSESGSSKNIKTASPSEQLSETGSSKNIKTVSPSEQLPATQQKQKTPPQDNIGFVARCQKVLKESADSLQTEFLHRSSGKNYVLFAFDEAHELMKEKYEILKTNSFFLMRRALSKLPDASKPICKFFDLLIHLGRQSNYSTLCHYAGYAR